MGKDTTVHKRFETVAKAASSGADTVRAHAGQAAEQVKQAAEPVRDAARSAATRQLAEQPRHTAASLTGRPQRGPPRRRSPSTRSATAWVVLPRGAAGLDGPLRARGYEPHFVEVSELMKAGGSPKCCVLELHQDDATHPGPEAELTAA